MIPAVGAAIAASLAVLVAVASLSGALSPERGRWRARTAGFERRPATHGLPVESVLRDESLSGNQSFNALLQRFQWANNSASLLERADLPLKVGEYLLIQVAAFAIPAALAWLLSGFWFIGVGFGVAGFIAVRVWVTMRASRRLNAFNKQLPIALHVMATSLRSGFSIMESVRAVAREMDKPLSVEFNRMLDETRLGASFEDSLNRMVQRVQSPDLHIVGRALDIHRKVGGDLASILEGVGQTMREREELRGHVIALTAQQRFGGMIVGLLPVWVIGFFAVTSPDFISPLWQEPVGRIFLGLGVTLEIIGFFLLRFLMKIEV